MRPALFVLTAVVLLLPAPSAAQWIEYTSMDDLFFVNFPREPQIEAFTYTSEVGADLPARRYTAESALGSFSMTVVDYRRIEEIMQKKIEDCPPDVHMSCRGTGPDGPTGSGYSKLDKAGAIDYATWHFIQRGGEITYFAWSLIDYIGGRWMHVTNPDASRSYYAMHMHEDRLYILEATVPEGYPEPGIFHQSMRFLDEQGIPVRYNGIYHNGYNRPTRANVGGRGGGPAQ